MIYEIVLVAKPLQLAARLYKTHGLISVHFFHVGKEYLIGVNGKRATAKQQYFCLEKRSSANAWRVRHKGLLLTTNFLPLMRVEQEALGNKASLHTQDLVAFI